MARYRKRPIIIDAYQWDGNRAKLHRWLLAVRGNANGVWFVNDAVKMITLDGNEAEAKEGDWVICGAIDELYPCRADVFDKTYEEIEK